MAKCPHCKKEIKYVDEKQYVTEFYKCELVKSINGNPYLDYNYEDCIDGYHDSYQCPECGKDIDLRSEDEVIKFLQG